MERNAETISFLDTVLQDVQTAELTQQIKLSDGMPDIGRILAAWGQVILRGKEWQEGLHELPEAEYLEGVRTEVTVGILAANANQQHYSRYHNRYPRVLYHVYMCISRRF